jgi:hypothetical protein
MAAELISIWGRGFLSMTDEEFASAREEGYTGPQQTLLLMEIGDESNVVDVNGLDPQIARIIGMTVDGLGDDFARMTDKVLTLTVMQLKEQLDKFEVRFPKSGPSSLKPNLQVILTDHLRENEVFLQRREIQCYGGFVSVTFAHC